MQYIAGLASFWWAFDKDGEKGVLHINGYILGTRRCANLLKQ